MIKEQWLKFAPLFFVAGLRWSPGIFAATNGGAPTGCEPHLFPDMPTPRLSLAATTSPDGRIFVIGGSTADRRHTLDSVEAYDPAPQSWATMSPMPTARSFLGAATGDDGLIYATSRRSVGSLRLGANASGLGTRPTNQLCVQKLIDIFLTRFWVQNPAE